jgi:glycosyltransferase involved in cell wall biosynthesis
MNGISVIICCYNSALKLPLTLAYLSKQKTNTELNWEIIIVNNNSTDKTVETAYQLWQSFKGNNGIRIINENKAGLSFARETGINAALYEIIIFCDDDNLFDENYIQYGYELVHRTKKQGYGIWGGESVAYFDADTIVPKWFEKEKANYVVGPQADQCGDISDRGYVWGAGMIILKDLLLQVLNNQFPLLLTGRKNNILLSGDDSEICLRSKILGYKLYYDSNLKFKHYIPRQKLTPQYNTGLENGFKQAYNILNKYSIFIYYVSGRNFFSRNYYAFLFMTKYILSKLNLRKLTDLDATALHALFDNKQFHDSDFVLMRSLLKMKE